MPQKKKISLPRRKSVKSSKPKMTFDKKVRKVLNKEMETKYQTAFLGGATDTVPLNIKASGLLGTSNGVKIANVFSINNLVIPQGTGAGERVGREISNCKLFLKATVQAAFYNSISNTSQFPFDIYCLIYKDKLQPNSNDATAIKLGVNNQQTFNITGTAMNLMAPWNRDRYTIYKNKRVGRFKPMPVDRTELPTGSTLQNPTIGSTDNIAFKSFTMRLPCPKKLQFVASSNDLATNSHLAVAFYVVDGSGAALASGSINGQIRATVFPQVTLYYKDS